MRPKTLSRFGALLAGASIAYFVSGVSAAAAESIDVAFEEAPATLTHILEADPGWAEIYGTSPTFGLGVIFDLGSPEPSRLVAAAKDGRPSAIAKAFTSDHVRCAVVLVDGVPTNSLYCVAPHPVTGRPDFLSLRELGDLDPTLATDPGEVIDISPFGIVALEGGLVTPVEESARYHLHGRQRAAEVLNALGTQLASNTRLALRGEEPPSGNSTPLLSGAGLNESAALRAVGETTFMPILVTDEVWQAVTQGQVTPAVNQNASDTRKLYVVQDGTLIDSGQQCLVGTRSLRCYEGDTQTLRTDNINWVRHPLPAGALVDATPHGWWVVADKVATPADDTAAQFADGPISTDDLVALASAHSASWPPPILGVSSPVFFGGLALLAASTVTAWLISARRRRSQRAGAGT